MDTAQPLDRLPAGAAWLGYGGLVPFVVPALAPLWDHHHGAVWGDVLFAYAAVILAFVGVKMLLVGHFHVPNLVSLGIIVGTLAGGVIASLWATRREERAAGD